MPKPRLFLLLSEVWTMTDPRDLPRLVECAQEAETAGVDGVMVGEHAVMGPGSAKNGIPANPRDWLRVSNQPPSFPHPSSLHVLSAMAAATTDLRLLAGAVLTPLRHPLLLAKELATVDLLSRGRLIVLPSVSWQREEYESLGVPFERRGRILDEQLEIWKRLWTKGSPVAFEGKQFRFGETWVEPQPYRPGGPVLWFGGRGLKPWGLRRLVAYGKGWFPVIPPTEEEMAAIEKAMRYAGRKMEELELGAFLTGGPFKGADDRIDLDQALAPARGLWKRGFRTFLIKPSVFIDDVRELGDLCRRAVAGLNAIVAD